MLKTMKKTLAFVLMTTLVLTSMSFSVMADAITNAYDGKTISSPAANVGITFSTEADGKGGKSASDTYYKMISATGTTSSYYQIDANIMVEDVFTYEMSFMLPQGSSGITLKPRFRVYRGSLDWQSPDMSITTSGFNPGGSYKALVPDTEFEYDKWYNLALVFPSAVANAEATEGYDYNKTMYIYVNGILKGEITYTTQSADYGEIIYYNRMWISPKDTNPVYIDNIRQYKNADRTYLPANDAPDTLTPSENGKVATIVNGRIGMTERLTVDGLIANITKDDDTNLRVYSSNGTLLSGTDIVADNSVLVAAASNGTGMERTYSYYTVAKDATILPGLLDGTMAFSSVTNSKAVEYGVSGTNGKEADDKVYKLTSIGGVTNGTRANANLFPFAITTTTNTAVKALFELQFMLPEGSKGIAIHNHYWGSSNDTSELWITPKGFGVKWSSENDATYYTDGFDYNKWYTLSISYNGRDVAGAGAGKNTSDIYVNGELAKAGFAAHTLATYGIREVRLTSVLNNSAEGNADVVYAYVDNLRLLYGTTVPQYDAEETFTTTLDTDLKTDKIFINGETTVAAVKETITGLNEDSNLKFYNASGALVTDGTVGNGYTVVVSAKNGTDHVRTISYYTVENISGKFVIKAPVYSGEEYTVNASFDTINNTDVPVSVSAIMALYDYNGSLKRVTPVVCTTDANDKGSFADDITMTADDDDDYIKFMIWASTDGDITPKMPDVILFDK